MGSAVGRIKAHDLDIGKNAEVEYTIVPGDGGAMFDITTNEHNQEGIIILKRVRNLRHCEFFSKSQSSTLSSQSWLELMLWKYQKVKN